jgi:ribosomal protein S18 acetylase RimI-like enzyme
VQSGGLKDAQTAIRPAVAQDAPALAQIERRCFDAAIYGHILLSESEFSRMIGRPRSSVIVAEIDGRVAGYAAVFYLRAKRLTWFYSHAVDREYRGIGVGTHLFRGAEALAVANDCPCMILEILGKQELFRRYTRYGYRVIREIPGFYPDGSTAIRMAKQLAVPGTREAQTDSIHELAAV